MRKTRISDFFFHRIPFAVSIIFHPLVMPTLGILLVLHVVVPISLMSANSKMLLFLMVFFSTLIIPVAFVPFMYYKRLQQFIHRNDRHERVLPLIFTSFMYYLSFFMLRRLDAPLLIQVFIFASTVSVVCALIINFLWKISAHTIGIGGLTAFILVLLLLYRIDLRLYLILPVLLSGIIASSRLGLNSHTPSQVYMGYLVGFGVMLGTFLLI